MAQKDKLHTGPAPVQLKLEVLMRGMSREERMAVLAESGYSNNAWWSWCKRPRIITAGAMLVLLAHLERKHGRQFSFQEVMQPVL